MGKEVLTVTTLLGQGEAGGGCGEGNKEDGGEAHIA